jgi:hypothetical protein
LETKWGSLISCELAAHLLKDTRPVAETVNAASVRNHLDRVAERAEAALGDERVSFIEGCPREWAALPHPRATLTVDRNPLRNERVLANAPHVVNHACSRILER